jgi:hypothetical protein
VVGEVGGRLAWGASGLTGEPAVAVRVIGFVIGVLILLGSALLQRRARRAGAAGQAGSRSVFASTGYRLVGAGEVIALVGGGVLLRTTGHSEYTVAWYACVVGVHFVVFGRLFWAGFYWLGTALVAAGFAGAVVGFAGGGSGAIRAIAAFDRRREPVRGGRLDHPRGAPVSACPVG